MFKKFLATVAVTLAATTGGSAATLLADVTPNGNVTGSAASVRMTLPATGDADTLLAINKSPVAFTIGTSVVTDQSPLPTFGQITATSLQTTSSPQIIFFSLTLGVPTNILSGDFLDSSVDLGSNTVTALFETTGGVEGLQPDFSDYFIVTLIPDGAPFGNGLNSAALSLETADLTAVPLPAGAVLLIGGLGVLAASRRRKAI